MTPKQLFETGDLQGAMAALTQEVKANPSDPGRRAFMFDLLCFMGEIDRAEKQLDVIKQLNTQAEWTAQIYGNLIECERIRRRCYETGTVPEFLLDPPESVRLHVDALGRLAAGRPMEAVECLAQAAEMSPALAGKANDQPFHEFRDCDDLLAPVLEVMILRDYIWLPYSQIRTLEILPPERPRDLIWAPAQFTLTDGTDRKGYLPALYCGSHRRTEDQIKLGRLTDWIGGESEPVLGVGQHQLLAGDSSLGLLEIRRLNFNFAI